MARIILDVDGVMAEFTHHLCDKIGMRVEKPDPTTFTKWDFIREHLTPEQNVVACDILSGHDFWATQPLMPGAKDAVDCFHKRGHDVHFVTSPWGECMGWANVRVQWVKENLGVDHKFVHVSGHKYLFNGAVFVDDRFEHVDAWQNDQNAHEMYDHIAFLFDAPYNKSLTWDPRLFGWSDQAGIERILHIAAGRGDYAKGLS